MDERRGPLADKVVGALLGCAIACGIVGGVILATAWFASLPGWLLAGAVGCWLIGLVLAWLAAYRRARNDGADPAEAAGKAFSTAWWFIKAMFP